MKRYAFATVVALLLHALVLFALTTSWSQKAPDTFRIPQYVSAKLVVLPKPTAKITTPVNQPSNADKKKVADDAAKKKAAEAVAQQKSADALAQKKLVEDAARKLAEKQAADAVAKKQADAVAAAAAQKKLDDTAKAKAKAAESAAATQKAAAEAAKKALDDQAKLKAQALQKQQEADALARAAAAAILKKNVAAQEAAARAALEGSILEGLDAEERFLEAQSAQASADQLEASSYFQMIERQIMLNWSRPASTRNGMFVGMEIHLLPNGELKDVFIIASSGDSATDLSAERAVRKVTRYEVPKDTSLFEQYFRKFEMGFRPEDLKQ